VEILGNPLMSEDCVGGYIGGYWVMCWWIFWCWWIKIRYKKTFLIPALGFKK